MGLYRLYPDSEKEKENSCRSTGRILNRLKIIGFWCSVQKEKRRLAVQKFARQNRGQHFSRSKI